MTCVGGEKLPVLLCFLAGAWEQHSNINHAQLSKQPQATSISTELTRTTGTTVVLLLVLLCDGFSSVDFLWVGLILVCCRFRRRSTIVICDHTHNHRSSGKTILKTVSLQIGTVKRTTTITTTAITTTMAAIDPPVNAESAP